MYKLSYRLKYNENEETDASLYRFAAHREEYFVETKRISKIVTRL